MLVEQSETKSLQHTCAAVVCGTPADTDDKIPAAVSYSVPYHLTDTESCGLHRVTLLRRNESKPRSRRHLHYCGIALPDNAIFCSHRPAAGVSHFDRPELPTHFGSFLLYAPRPCGALENFLKTSLSSLNMGIDSPFAAVCKRSDCNISIGIYPLYALRCGIARLKEVRLPLNESIAITIFIS